MSGLVRIDTLPVGTAIEYTYSTMDLSNPKAKTDPVTVKGYVGETTYNPSGKPRVTIMRTKTTGKRYGSVAGLTSVKVR